MKLWTKICGITRAEDAVVAAEAGADAIGINFFEESQRYCDAATAAGIVSAVGDRVVVYGVFVGASPADVSAMVRRTGIGGVQLHGGERPADVERFCMTVGGELDWIRAVAVTSRETVVEAVVEARGYRVLFDSPRGGGSGSCFDEQLVSGVSLSDAIVAGGLTPDNVGELVDRLRPFGVDSAGGVELSPGVKDHVRIREFIDHARASAT